MPQQSPIERLRPAASRTIATNVRLMEGTPKRGVAAPGEIAENPWGPLTSLPGGVAEGLGKHLEKRATPPTSRNERLAQRLTKTHLKGGGVAGDVAELAAAKDKRRAAASIAGSRAAGYAAGFVPPQFVTVPAASVAGSWLGGEAYDRWPAFRDAVEAELYTLKDQLGRELKHYIPYDLVDRFHQR